MLTDTRHEELLRERLVPEQLNELDGPLHAFNLRGSDGGLYRLFLDGDGVVHGRSLPRMPDGYGGVRPFSPHLDGVNAAYYAYGVRYGYFVDRYAPGGNWNGTSEKPSDEVLNWYGLLAVWSVLVTNADLMMRRACKLGLGTTDSRRIHDYDGAI